MASVQGYLNPDPTIRLVRNGSIINKTLSAICNAENLAKAGVKAELQSRIIESTSTSFGKALPEHLQDIPSLALQRENLFLTDMLSRNPTLRKQG